MIDNIIKIGQELEKLGLESDQFSEKSSRLLEGLETSLTLDKFSSNIGLWVLNKQLPKQLNVYNAFGQPPLTIFRCKTFVIDIYFWMHADTSIHSHAFCGAFKVLYGKSLHEQFKTEEIELYSHDTCLNKLTRTETQILKSGSIKKISRGEDFIHRVVHLSAPTVTLCIRTVDDLDIPQWHHFDNGLSILKKELDESIFKKLFYGDYLFQTKQEIVLKYTNDFIMSLETSELMNFFEQLTVDTMGLSEDYQELIYNTMMTRLSAEPWFHLYESYCEEIQLYQQHPEMSEQEKFELHAEFYKYESKEIESLSKEI
jgi:hypothetical protein